jgi:hypothetical protein
MLSCRRPRKRSGDPGFFQRYDTTAFRGSARAFSGVAGRRLLRALLSGRLFRRAVQGKALALRGTCSCAGTEVQGEVGDCRQAASVKLPRGQWPRTGRDSREGRLSAGELPAKSAPYLAPRV